MATFLVRDYTQLAYKPVSGPLPRTRELSYTPWALTPDGRVVYAPIAEARGTPPNGTGLRPYDTLASQERRALCHTRLGVIALTCLEFSRPAVLMVSSGVLWFLFRRLRTDTGIKKTFAEKVGKYLYGTSYRSFGRFTDSNATGGNDQIWAESLEALRNGKRLETILNIQEGVGRQILEKQDLEYPIYDAWRNKLRAEGAGEIIREPTRDDQSQWRGRLKKAASDYTATDLPGNVRSIPTGSENKFPKLQIRNRGADMYRRIQPSARPSTPVAPEKSGNVYYEQLDLRNELFAAGPSGTTGTALAAGLAFGKFSVGSERMKEYLFAIVGYLVGGGMHSLHESLSILRLIGLEYNTGTLLAYDFSNSPAQTDAQGLVRGQVSGRYPLLPQRFLASKEFEEWRDEYYDIVVLGGTHWRFNNRG